MEVITILFWIVLIFGVIGLVIGVAISTLRDDDNDVPECCLPKPPKHAPLSMRLRRAWRRH